MEQLNNTPDELLQIGNEIQIRLAKRLHCSLEEFANYYSYNFRRLFESYLNKDFPLKSDFLIIENKIFYYIEKHFYAGNVQQVKDSVAKVLNSN